MTSRRARTGARRPIYDADVSGPRAVIGRWGAPVLVAVVLGAAACSSSQHIELSPPAPATTDTTAVTTAPVPTVPATTAPASTAPPAIAAAPAHFVTLPPGSPLPSDEQCAALVRKAPEIRPQNASFNAVKGHGAPASPPAPLYARVTGNFTGTTDEILQWGACKWGIDEDIVRAQAAKESYWTQTNVGDNGGSFGILQVRQPYWGWAFNSGVGDAKSSTAYNVDASLAARRNCFEGNETWLGGTYKAGDIWGCVGLWFSGRWYDQPAQTYIKAVQDYLSQKIWLTSDFVNYR
jgi:autotransporter family porin